MSDSIPTPAHCVADFCLIPVSEKQQQQQQHKQNKTVYSIQIHTNLTDWHLITLSLRPDRRRPATDRDMRFEVCHAFRRHNYR
jgi:hypothetical protein